MWLVLLFLFGAESLLGAEEILPIREILRPVPFSYEFSPFWDLQRERALWQSGSPVILGKGIELIARWVRGTGLSDFSYARPFPIQLQGLLLSFYHPNFSLPADGFVADLHLHSNLSHDSTAPLEAILMEAERMGLKAIALTDHDLLSHPHIQSVYARLKKEGKVKGDLILIPGEEITTRDGHVVGLFLKEPIPPGLSAEETIARIHAQGGIAVAVHPHHRSGVGEILARSLPFDLRESRNPATLLDSPSGFLYDSSQRGIGVSDAHDPELVGSCVTWFPPDVTPSSEGILLALRRGTYKAVCIKDLILWLSSLLTSPVFFYPFAMLATWEGLWEGALGGLLSWIPLDRIEVYSSWSPWIPPWNSPSLLHTRSVVQFRKPLRFQGVKLFRGPLSLTFQGMPEEKILFIEMSRGF